MRFTRQLFGFALLMLSAVSFSAFGTVGEVVAADYEVREFEGGPARFVYDGPVNVALFVLKPDDPKCYEVGEIILLLKSRGQPISSGLPLYPDVAAALA